MSLYLYAPWGSSLSVRAVMTTRLGGLGGAEAYRGLNLGPNSGDDPARVAAHWEIVRRELGLSRLPLLLNQVHGRDLAEAEPHLAVRPEADGWLVRCPDLPVAVQVADCLPVVLTRSDGSLAALVHAGWKGLAAGIVDTALDELRKGYPGEIWGWVGPGIDGWAYEVGTEVRQALLAHYPWADSAFRLSVDGRYLADLGRIAHELLCREGCRSWRSRAGTWSRPDLWYSWRRGQPTGRQAMILWKES